MNDIATIDLKQICQKVCAITEQTSNFIRDQREKFSFDKVESKGLHNFVSYVDKEAEQMIVDAIKTLLPKAGFIAEEGTGESNPDGLNWVIDPLDGTTNFIHGLPPFAISIALMNKNEVLMGVVHEVSLNECFYSWGNNEVYLNGSKINVSDIQSISDSLIATGFPYYDYSRMEPFLQSMEYFMRSSHGMRRLGSAATDLAYVACGRFEGFYEYSLQPWDVAAGAFLVEQAGGKVNDFRGTKNHIFGKEIIASNTGIHNEFKDVIAQYFNKTKV